MTAGWARRLGTIVRRKRGKSFYFMIASLLFAAAACLSYPRTGISTFTPVLSGKVLTLLGVCVALGALFSLVEVKTGKYAAYLIALWMWLEYLFYHASYISNVLVGIDGNSFGPGFLLTAGCGLLTWLAALTSAILQKRELGSGDEDGEGGDA